ncbi:MAG: NADPH:quinone reductase [Meiothermus sp.]
MKASVIHKFGGLEELRLEEVQRPTPRQGEVLVRVHAAGVNPVDAGTRRGSGVSGGFKTFPAILGWDIAGVVEEIGPGVTRFKVGDAVYGMPKFPKPAGAYAEYAAAPADELARKPATLRFEEAAALPLAGLTAWQALEALNLQAGQTILIHAAAGGVGHLAVQMAKARGAKVVGTASSANEALVRELGANQFVDYTAQPFEQVVREMDAVFDCVGGEVTQRSLEVLKPGGTLVTIANAAPEERAKALGVRALRILVRPSGKDMESLNRLIKAGQLRVVVGATFDLADAAEAHRLSESRRARGKIVLRVV